MAPTSAIAATSGSATLAQGLAAAGLVDRYHLLVFPLVLGSGKRLFGEGDKTKLALVEHDRHDAAEPGVADLGDRRVLTQAGDEGLGVGLGALDAQVQGAHPAQGEPGL